MKCVGCTTSEGRLVVEDLDDVFCIALHCERNALCFARARFGRRGLVLLHSAAQCGVGWVHTKHPALCMGASNKRTPIRER